MRVRVEVMLKPSVLDPQGQAVARALRGAGFPGVEDVRQGKIFEIEVDEKDRAAAMDAAARMADALLANKVVERYRVLED